MFDVQCHRFEVAEYARRLFLASAIGMLDEDSSASPVAGLLIATVYTFVFTKLGPFKTAENNALAQILAYSLLLFFLAGKQGAALQAFSSFKLVINLVPSAHLTFWTFGALVALMIKLGAAEDGESEQEVFVALLVVVLCAGPVAVFAQFVYENTAGFGLAAAAARLAGGEAKSKLDSAGEVELDELDHLDGEPESKTSEKERPTGFPGPAIGSNLDK